MAQKNYYRILQVDPSAEPEVIEAAYRRLAVKYHPDTNRSVNATLLMQEINEAYAVLKDPVRRADYDQAGMGGSNLKGSRVQAQQAYRQGSRGSTGSHRQTTGTADNQNNYVYLVILANVVIILAIAASLIYINIDWFTGLLAKKTPAVDNSAPLIAEDPLVDVMTSTPLSVATQVPTTAAALPLPTIAIKPVQPTEDSSELFFEPEQPDKPMSPMQSLVNELYENNVISSPNGRYYDLPDFNEVWKQPEGYYWQETNYRGRNYVVRAKLLWDTAVMNADMSTAGCGFVFAARDQFNHYRIYLALDGSVHLNRIMDGRYIDMGYDYYQQLLLPSGDADVVFVVEDDRLYFYVNDWMVTQLTDLDLRDGELAYAVSTAGAEGYGIHCRVEDVELWALP